MDPKRDLYDKVVRIDKLVKEVKFLIEDYATGYDSLKKRTVPLQTIFSNGTPDDLKENPELYNIITKIYKTLTEYEKISSVMYNRVYTIGKGDIENFLSHWNALKEQTKRYAEMRPQDIVERTFRKNEIPAPDVRRDTHEKKKIENMLKDNLGELVTAMKEYIHAHVYFHAKSLELWANLWSNIAPNLPPLPKNNNNQSKRKPKQNDPDAPQENQEIIESRKSQKFDPQQFYDEEQED